MARNRARRPVRSRLERSGFTLIESLVALALITLALFLGTKLILMEPRILERLEAGERAIRALEAALETLRSGDLPLRQGVLVPPAAYPLGLAAPGFLLLGYLLPGLLEQLIRRAAETLHLLSLGVALVGLLLHALLDGAGLAGSSLRAEPELAAAIILHRFGVGLMLWLIVQPVFGVRVAWLTLFAMAAATIVGFEFSERLLPLADDRVISALQGVIVGTIIHGLVHRGHVHRQIS